jgi:hypothetical protein
MAHMFSRHRHQGPPRDSGSAAANIYSNNHTYRCFFIFIYPSASLSLVVAAFRAVHQISHGTRFLAQPFRIPNTTAMTNELSETFSNRAQGNYCKSGPESSWRDYRCHKQFRSPPQGSWTPYDARPSVAIGDWNMQNNDARYGGNRFNGSRENGYHNKSNNCPKNGLQHQRERGQRKNAKCPRSPHKSTPPSASRQASPFGANLSHQDRVQAVQRWKLTPNNIAVQEALAREKNREARLAREALEAATGIKEPPLVQPSLFESFKKMDINAKDGKTASRAVVGKETRGLQQQTPPHVQTVPPPALVPTTTPVSGPIKKVRHSIRTRV